MSAATVHHNLPLPEIDEVNRPFWDGARASRFLLMRCDDCGRFRFPPNPACKKCLSMKGTWTPASGRGAIWSWAVLHKAYFPEAEVPYRVAIVELAEGPLIATNIVDAREDQLRIGAPVEVTFKKLGGDITLPVFRLAT